MGAHEQKELAKEAGIPHIPTVYNCFYLRDSTSVSDLLSKADGISFFEYCLREGLVFKFTDGNLSFKAIGNAWLLDEN